MDQFENMSKVLLDQIIIFNTIIIHRHINPDGDALGSQWGLKKIIEENFNNKRVLVPGENSYNLSQFFPNADLVKEEDYKDALVIVCDTANKERISGEFWQKGKLIFKVDHHPEVDNYSQYNLVQETATAACQVVSKWAKIMNLKVSLLAAEYLYLGLVTDSGRFLYRSVGKETFEIAAFLINKGFNISNLYSRLYLQNLKIARIKGYILNNFKITQNGVGYFICKNKDFKKIIKAIKREKSITNCADKAILLKEEVSAHVNLLSNIDGINIWLIACQDNITKEFKVSVRSTNWIINSTVSKFNGGGHANAAGCKLADLKAVKKLIIALDNLIDKGEQNV